jgi:hypothetical protein
MGAHLRVVPRVLDDVARVRGRDADHLGDVQRRAAAEADDAIGSVRLEGRRALHHLAGGRIAEHAAEHRDLEALQVAAELGQHRQRRQRLVGDDQRALQPLLRRCGPTSLRAPAPKTMEVGKEKLDRLMVGRRLAVRAQMISK